MFYSNSLNLIQVCGGTQVKQGDLGSKFSYKLANEKDQELDDFDKEVAHIDLVLDDKIVFTTTATVDKSTVTFNIDKAIPVGLYFLEIKIRDYIFPSDKQTIIFVQSGAVAYDLKELVPNYDVNMTLKGILSDLSQKGIDISDLKTKMNAIYNNALADHGEVSLARGQFSSLDGRLDNADRQLARKANESDLAVERERINKFTTLAAGSTTGDAELIDARIGANGFMYENLGGAIRQQIKGIYEDIYVYTNNLLDFRRTIKKTKVIPYDNNQTLDNCTEPDDKWVTFNTVVGEANESFVFLKNINTSKNAFANVFNSNKSLSRVAVFSRDEPITLQKDEKYIVASLNIVDNPLTGEEQIKKTTSDLTIFEPYANVIVTSEEKEKIITDISGLKTELEGIFKESISITTKNGLWNTEANGLFFEGNPEYQYAEVGVNENDVIYITATQLSDYNFKGFAIKNSSGQIIYTPHMPDGYIFNDYKFICPAGSASIVLNSKSTVGIKLKKSNNKKIDMIENHVNTLDEVGDRLKKDIIGTQEWLYRSDMKNPFKYAKPDTGYITFVFDDGRQDLDLVASIFESYNIPLSVAIPPDALNSICSGLKNSVGSYTVGMTVKEVCEKIVNNGGEVLSHSWEPVTLKNYLNFDFMYDKFSNNKILLEDAGFNIRGIILAGGDGAIYGDESEIVGKELQKWSSMYYDYSDSYGVTPQYSYRRVNMNDTFENIKKKIDDARQNKKWLPFFCHTLDGSEINLSEANLKRILQYCKDNSLKCCTYATFYDTFKSSELEQRLLGTIGQ